jgi:hypothetical protein
VLSDFQLIAGSNRDLRSAVREGRFREDLLARIDLWTFTLPGLAQRREDIEPNLDYELERFARDGGRRVTLNREARERFLRFATAPAAAWSANFRDLGAAVLRMATLATGGRIDEALVREETARLEVQWRPAPVDGDDPLARLLGAKADQLDASTASSSPRWCGCARRAASPKPDASFASPCRRTAGRRPPAEVPRPLRPGLGWGARGCAVLRFRRRARRQGRRPCHAHRRHPARHGPGPPCRRRPDRPADART